MGERKEMASLAGKSDKRRVLNGGGNNSSLSTSQAV